MSYKKFKTKHIDLKYEAELHLENVLSLFSKHDKVLVLNRIVNENNLSYSYKNEKFVINKYHKEAAKNLLKKLKNETK